MDNHFFRSALGGFNRQDVMEYVERTQKEAEAAAAALTAQVEELQRTGEETRRQLETCTQEREELARQLEDMTLRCGHAKNNWEAQAQAKESFRQDVAQRDQTIREITEENQRLFRRVEELEGQMEDLRRQKEQVAQLELDARQRSSEVVDQAQRQAAGSTAQAQSQAEETVRQAQSQAEAILDRASARSEALLLETEERLNRTADQYGQFSRTVEAALAQITGEIQTLRGASERLPGCFQQLREGLEELQGQAKER